MTLPATGSSTPSKFADNDCQISGRITFTQTPVKNTYTCVFESEQICGKLSGNLYIKSAHRNAPRSASASRSPSNPRSTRSSIVGPKFRTPRTILADNFIVQLSNNKAEIEQLALDEQRQLEARFWRDVELIG